MTEPVEIDSITFARCSSESNVKHDVVNQKHTTQLSRFL